MPEQRKEARDGFRINNAFPLDWQMKTFGTDVSYETEIAYFLIWVEIFF